MEVRLKELISLLAWSYALREDRIVQSWFQLLRKDIVLLVAAVRWLAVSE
jgi:hypothetical protein